MGQEQAEGFRIAHAIGVGDFNELNMQPRLKTFVAFEISIRHQFVVHGRNLVALRFLRVAAM